MENNNQPQPKNKLLLQILIFVVTFLVAFFGTKFFLGK